MYAFTCFHLDLNKRHLNMFRFGLRKCCPKIPGPVSATATICKTYSGNKMWFSWASFSLKNCFSRNLICKTKCWSTEHNIVFWSVLAKAKLIFFSSFLLLKSSAIATAFASRLVRHSEPLEQTGSGRALQAAGPRLWRDGRRQEAPGLLVTPP